MNRSLRLQDVAGLLSDLNVPSFPLAAAFRRHEVARLATPKGSDEFQPVGRLYGSWAVDAALVVVKLGCRKECHPNPPNRRRRGRNHRRPIECGNSGTPRLRSMECEVAPWSRRSHDRAPCRIADRSIRLHIWFERAIPRQQGSALASAQVRFLLANLEPWQTCSTNRDP